MLLYRGDRKEDLRKMITSDEFIYTNYNRGNVKKNDAQFYFLSNTIELASYYNSEVVSVWEADGKILDITIIANRYLVAHLFTSFYFQQVEVAKSNIEVSKKEAIRKYSKKAAKEDSEKLEKLLKTNPIDFVVNSSIWYQSVGDDNFGVVFKNWLKENGYLGYCTKEDNLGLTYGLVEKPLYCNTI